MPPLLDRIYGVSLNLFRYQFILEATEHTKAEKLPFWRALTVVQRQVNTLLQLRQYLSEEALRAIENLGHSSSANEVEKEL